MNWYKQTQRQGNLFYPWQSSSETVIERQQPDRNQLYTCGICNKKISTDEIEDWMISKEEKNKYFYNKIDLNPDSIKREAIYLANSLNPYLDKLEEEQEKKKKENSRYNDFVNIDIPNAKDILNHITSLAPYVYALAGGGASPFPYAYEATSSKRASSWLVPIFRILNDEGISNDVFKAHYSGVLSFIKNPQIIFNDIDSFIKESYNYETQVEVPVCKDCFKDTEKCDYCEQPLYKSEHRYPSLYTRDYDNKDFYCSDCINKGIIDVCSDCGLAGYAEDFKYLDNEGYLCDECYKEYYGDYENIKDKIEEFNNKEKVFDSWFNGEEKVFIPFKKNNTLQRSDQDLIQALAEKGWKTDNEDYRAGYAYKDGRKMRIGKILDLLQSQDTKNIEIGPESEEEQNNERRRLAEYYRYLKLDFMSSSFRSLKNVKDTSIVISQDAHDIAKMSTDRNWTSCMDFAKGEKSDEVWEELEEGGFIAYLINNDDKEIEEPLARVLIRRYQDKDGKSIAMVENTSYGVDVDGFVQQVKDWVDSKQGKIPKNTYWQQGMSWTDSLRGSYVFSKKLFFEIFYKQGCFNQSNWYKTALKETFIH